MKLVSADGTETEATMTQAIYCVAAVKMNLDLAPTKRVVDSFVKRLFDCTIEDLNLDQQHAVAMHIKHGDVQAHAAEVINSRAFNDPAESLVNMPVSNGKKKLIDMTDDELDAQSAQAQEEFAMRRAAEQPTIDLHAERERRVKGNGRKSASTPAPAPMPRPTGEEHLYVIRLIPIDVIAINPCNPRRTFDAIKLSEVAQSMRERGVDTPLWIRPQPGMKEEHGKFQLIAGERRLRAATLAGLTEVPCRVYCVDDAIAADMCFSENHDRADLNAVEEARSIDMMIRVGGHTQEQMAARLGIEQGTLANKLGILKLPEDWQARIISGEITPTHARCLPKWANHPHVLAEVEKRIKERMRGDYNVAVYFPNSEEFTDIVMACARHIGRPIVGDYSITTANGGNRHGKVLIKPTAEHRDELRLETVKDYDGNRQYAFNVELWEQLQEQAKKAEKKKQQASLDKAGTKSPNGSAKSEIASAEAFFKLEREREERDEPRKIWIVNHIKSLIRSSVDIFLDSQIRTIVYVTEAISDSGLMKAAISFAGGKPVNIAGYGHNAIDLLASLSTLPGSGIDAMEKMERKLVELWAQEEVTWTTPRDLIDTANLAAWLNIDPITSWHPTKECLELFTLDEMRAIGKDWKFHAAMIAIAQDRAAMMNLLLTPGPRRPMPSILAKLLPKTKPVKTKKGKK